jgi:hypothetical protein
LADTADVSMNMLEYWIDEVASGSCSNAGAGNEVQECIDHHKKENAMTNQVRQAETSGMVKAVSVADYIVERLAAEGINHCFGVAGDYVFPICDAVDSSDKVKWIGCANELNAAYAADGYARTRGAAMLVTTYGVGELSALNGVMGAKAERSLVFHVVGMPPISISAWARSPITRSATASSAISSICPLVPRAVMLSSIRRTALSKWSVSSRRRAATISLPISPCRRTMRYLLSCRLT